MRIGILGGGQLGRMLALAGHPLGMEFRILESAEEVAAGPVADVMRGEYEDETTLEQFSTGLEVVTYEFENVPARAARFLAERLPVFPPEVALDTAQDRLNEKSLFTDLKIPVPPYQTVESREQLDAAVADIGIPAVLKRRRLGYDGKGQYVIQEPADVENAWQALAGAPLILEGFVDFEREVSILAVRRRNGDTIFYPLVENHHHRGILRLSFAPAPDTSAALQKEAEGYAMKVLKELGYVGVLAIEFFQKDGHLLANEMAPRVHNSGHWSIEGAETSQFENHLRAVADYPLGPTDVMEPSAMLNLIGRIPETREILEIPGAHLHLYGKSPKPGRKLGHVTVTAAGDKVLQKRLKQLERIVGLPALG